MVRWLVSMLSCSLVFIDWLGNRVLFLLVKVVFSLMVLVVVLMVLFSVVMCLMVSWVVLVWF